LIEEALEFLSCIRAGGLYRIRQLAGHPFSDPPSERRRAIRWQIGAVNLDLSEIMPGKFTSKFAADLEEVGHRFSLSLIPLTHRDVESLSAFPEHHQLTAWNKMGALEEGLTSMVHAEQARLRFSPLPHGVPDTKAVACLRP